MKYETFWSDDETFVPGATIRVVLRVLEEGREKYRAEPAKVLILGPVGDAEGDELVVRSRVGNVVCRVAVRVEERLPDTMPGMPYDDYYEALSGGES